MSGMYLQYGSYQHPSHEASIARWIVRPRYNARGFRVAYRAEAHVSGEIVLASGEDQYALSTKIQALENAFKVDGSDFGLYHANGTPTPHYLQSDHPSTLTGNQIVYFSYPVGGDEDPGGPGEYSTGRRFSYVVANEYLAPDSIILEYSEEVIHVGDCGPTYEWIKHRGLAPYWVRTAPASTQLIIQQGKARTLATWLVPPDPLLGAPYEKTDQRRISRLNPVRFPQGFEAFEISWRYVFESDVIQPVFPNIR